jgi:hypothetical protein
MESSTLINFMNFQSDKNVEKKDQKLMYPYIQAIFPAFQMEKELTEYFFFRKSIQHDVQTCFKFFMIFKLISIFLSYS